MSSELPAPTTATLRRQLGKEGLFRLGVPRSLGGHGGTKEDVIRAVAAVAKRHPKSGVLLASQRLLIEALLQAENIGVMEYQLPDLLEGHIGGNCAASWPSESAVSLADARDTGRGWRMSGRFTALPNLDRDWFVVSVPVAFGTGTPYALVLLKSEEDGIVQRDDASQGCSGVALELRNVFLREDEILFSDGKSAVERLTVLSESMKAALVAGALRRVVNDGESNGLVSTIDSHLGAAGRAVTQDRLDRGPRVALEALLAGLQGASACVPSTGMAVA